MFKFKQCLLIRDALLGIFYYMKKARYRKLEDQEYAIILVLIRKIETALNTIPGPFERIALWWRNKKGFIRAWWQRVKEGEEK